MSARRLLCGLTASALTLVVVGAQAATSGAAQAKPPAPKGSMVYIKKGNVYEARTDGSHAHLVRKGSFNWTSMDDKGVIVAIAPDGTDSVAFGLPNYWAYRMTAKGKILSKAPTPVNYTGPGSVASEPDHLALSPDGSKLAYDFDLNGQRTTLWTPSKVMNFGSQGAGQEDWEDPVWTDNQHLLLSLDGVPLTDDGAMFGVYSAADGQNSVQNWFRADDWALMFQATATRNAKKIAYLEDDSAGWIPPSAHHVRLVLLTSSGLLTPVTVKCGFDLPPASFQTFVSSSMESEMHFTPDGRTLVFESDKGLYRVNTSDLDSCSTAKPHLWLKGAFAAAFSPAAAK